MSLTISTIGITRIAKRSAIAYSVKPTGVKPNALARKGISSTAVVRTREPAMAIQRILLCEGRVKMDLRCERILNEWKISHMLIVRNAIVIPCSEIPWGIAKCPASKEFPMIYDIIVSAVTRKP